MFMSLFVPLFMLLDVLVHSGEGTAGCILDIREIMFMSLFALAVAVPADMPKRAPQTWRPILSERAGVWWPFRSVGRIVSSYRRIVDEKIKRN